MTDNSSSPRTNGRNLGTGRAYLLDRLAREGHTEWLKRIEAGEVSAFSVAVHLGWAKRPPTKYGEHSNQAKRRRRLLSRDTELTHGQEMELWLGPSHRGSVFRSSEEAETAWLMHRERLMAAWAKHGRRPAGWWAFEAPFARPDHDVERSALWEADLLSEEERAELELDWKREFDRAQRRGFWYCNGPGDFFEGKKARAAHYQWADIPERLIREWTAQRRRTKTPASEEVVSEQSGPVADSA